MSGYTVEKYSSLLIAEKYDVLDRSFLVTANQEFEFLQFDLILLIQYLQYVINR